MDQPTDVNSAALGPFAAQFPAGSLAPDARTLIDLLQSTAQAHPDAPAIDDGERIISYAELVAEVKTLGLQVTHGQIVGLTGPNASGKTTTLRMISGYAAPSEGRILVNGRPLKELKSAGNALCPVLDTAGAPGGSSIRESSTR